MTFITHEQDPSLSIEGTCLQGYAMTEYYRVLEVFGRPKDGDGYKTDVEWVIQFEDGLIATIYNWKNGPAYLGGMAEVKHIDEWNIGGHSRDAADRVRALLASSRGRA